MILSICIKAGYALRSENHVARFIATPLRAIGQAILHANGRLKAYLV
jgi:hypothetical protein